MVLKLRDRMIEGPAGIERPYTADELLEMARGVDLAAFDCAAQRSFIDARYARNTIFENEHFELVLICWKPGQASAIHDHGESLCLYLVIEGEFEERLFELGADGEPRQTGARTWKTGDITLATGPDVHQLVNAGPDNLITVHVYSPPLKQTSKNYTPVPRTAV